MAKKTWGYSPRKQSSPKAPDAIKKRIKDKADELVSTVLIPQFVKPPPEDYPFNYLVDIYNLQHRPQWDCVLI